MRINFIEMRGFSSYRDYTHIDIPVGIIGILGSYDENAKRSNGSGKSGLMSVVLYTLFSEGEFSTIGEIRNSFLDESDDFYAKMEFELNGNTYLIERGMKGKSSYLDLYENGNRRGMGIADTEKEIIEILGMDYKLFTASIFFVQSGMDNFINTSPSDRRSYIDSILGLDVWREAYKEASGDNKKTKEEKGAVEALLSTLTTEAESLVKDISGIPAIKKIIGEATERKKGLEVILHSNEYIQKLRTLLSESQKEKSELDRSLSDIVNQLQNSTDRYTENKKRLSKLSAPDISRIPVLQQENAILEEKIRAVTCDIETVRTHLMERTAHRISTNSTRETIVESLNNLIDGVCPTCLQMVDENHLRKKRVELSQKVDDITILIISTDEEISFLKSQVQIDEDILRSLRDDKETRHTEIDTIQSSVREHELNELSIKGAIDIDQVKIDSLSKNKNDLMSRYRKLEESVATLEKEIAASGIINIDINKIELELADIDGVITQRNVDLGRLTQKEEDLKSIRGSIEENKKTLKDIENSLSLYVPMLKAFQDIPTEELEKSIISIESAANSIIRTILPPMSVRIYEDSSKKNRPLMISFDVDGKPRSYKRLSGGEKTVANIGLRLGFNKVISEKAKVSLNCLFLDEIFGSLDDENRVMVLKILAELQKNFSQILCITHTGEAEDFPNIIHVRKDSSGNSYIN